jgi:hypothetical protein
MDPCAASTAPVLVLTGLIPIIPMPPVLPQLPTQPSDLPYRVLSILSYSHCMMVANASSW